MFISMQGATSTGSTGPSSAQSGAQYLYIEASAPRTAGNVARIQTSAKFPSKLWENILHLICRINTWSVTNDKFFSDLVCVSAGGP